jgi:phosphinothricin acetyltransferase
MALIRAVAERDIDAIARIYAHYVRHSTATFEIDPPDPSEMDRRRLEILSHGLPYLAAELNGVVMGYAYASPYRPRPAYRFTVEDSIYIHPDFVARGIGRLLLTRVIECCEVQGSRQMVAIIGDSGNVASIRLHRVFGFHTVGILQGVGLKFDRWIDTVIMQRALLRSTDESSTHE